MALQCCRTLTEASLIRILHRFVETLESIDLFGWHHVPNVSRFVPSQHSMTTLSSKTFSIVEELRRCVHLRHLGLGMCAQFSDFNLRQLLLALPSLDSLDFRGCKTVCTIMFTPFFRILLAGARCHTGDCSPALYLAAASVGLTVRYDHRQRRPSHCQRMQHSHFRRLQQLCHSVGCEHRVAGSQQQRSALVMTSQSCRD